MSCAHITLSFWRSSQTYPDEVVGELQAKEPDPGLELIQLFPLQQAGTLVDGIAQLSQGGPLSQPAGPKSLTSEVLTNFSQSLCRSTPGMWMHSCACSAS